MSPVEPLKQRFWDNSEILLFSHRQQQIFITVNIILGIKVPDYFIRTLETTLLRKFQINITNRPGHFVTFLRN